jgi:hypothetical protein
MQQFFDYLCVKQKTVSSYLSRAQHFFSTAEQQLLSITAKHERATAKIVENLSRKRRQKTVLESRVSMKSEQLSLNVKERELKGQKKKKLRDSIRERCKESEVNNRLLEDLKAKISEYKAGFAIIFK